MPEKQRILITGLRGLIGRALGESLRKKGYDVWGVDLEGDPARQVVAANLLSLEETQRAVAGIAPFSVVIHTAALAHGQTPPAGQTVFGINTGTTANVLAAVEAQSPRFVFLSSVSVYGEDGRREAVRVSDETKPSSEYGRSKLACEKLVQESSLEHCDILRLAPVFDTSYLINVKRRVFLPGLSRVKMRLHPSPRHSLCRLDTVVQTVCALLEGPPAGRRILNVCDPQPYDQREIASWFPGASFPVPVFLLKPLYGLLRLLPSRSGYALRCMYWKLFDSNVYSNEGQGE